MNIASNIPCRIESVAKVQFDPITDLCGKIVRLDSVNYETGMSTVTILPTMKQTNIHIRSLQEIPLNEKVSSEFVNYSRNYFEFLKLISKISVLEEFDVGLFETIPDKSTQYGNTWRNKFGEIETEIFLNEDVQNKNYFCSCLTFSDDSTKLCRHIISSLDQIIRNHGYLGTPITQNNDLYDGVMNFIGYISFDHIDALSDYLGLDVSRTLKIYLQTHANLKN